MTRYAIGLTLLLLISSGAHALGFRSITVHSLLSEPLDARIGLVGVDPDEIDDLNVSLAGEATFEKAGIPRSAHLTQLSFKPELNDKGQVYIHVSSRQPVSEPFLAFLVEITWKGVTSVREYTVLLDPPVIRKAAARVIQPPTPVSRPVAPAAAVQVARPRAAAIQVSPDQPVYGPVKRGETLWTIAEQLRPDATVSIEQMMMALQERNPEAFQQGNVNLIKQGYRLYMPDRALIDRLSPGEARQAFLRQTRDWRNGRGRTVAEGSASSNADRVEAGRLESRVPVPADGAVTLSLEAPSVDTRNREAELAESGANDLHQPALRVVEPVTEMAAESGVAGAAATVSTEEERLKKDIVDARHDLAAIREINRDLAELKEVLEDKISTLRRSLEEKNQLIEALAEKAAAVSPVAGPIGSASQEDAGEAGASAPVEIATGTAKPLPRKGATAVAESGIPAPQPQQPAMSSPESAVFGWIQTYWLPMLVGILLSFALLIGFVIRKRRATRGLLESDHFIDFMDADDRDAREYKYRARSRYGVDPEPADATPEENDGDFRLSDDGDDASVLTEADIFLAYRRYNQAENLIRDAIENNPGSMVLKAKLLEIYAFRADRKNFAAFMEETYPKMSANEPDIWAKVVEMGRDLIPEHRLISGINLPEVEADDLPEFSWAKDVPDGPSSASGRKSTHRE